MTQEEISNKLFKTRIHIDVDKSTNGESNYKLEIGSKVFDVLVRGLALEVFPQEDGVAPQVMGIPIEINYANPNVIKLWKEVTDEI